MFTSINGAKLVFFSLSSGIIPFNRDAVISVTFSPTEFCTATMTIQLIISQFNSKPIVCSFYGSSVPGLARLVYGLLHLIWL